MQTYLIEQGLAAEATLYQVSCFDDELDDTLISLHPDYDTALIEADENVDAVCSVKALTPTQRLIERLGFPLIPSRWRMWESLSILKIASRM